MIDFSHLPRLLPGELHTYGRLETAFTGLLERLHGLRLDQRFFQDAFRPQPLADSLTELWEALRIAGALEALHQWETIAGSESDARQLLMMGGDATPERVQQFLEKKCAHDEVRWAHIRKHIGEFAGALLARVKPVIAEPRGRKNRPRPVSERGGMATSLKARPGLQALAHVALGLARALESFYPIEGRDWAAAGQPELPGARPVQEALARLRTCWYEPVANGVRKIQVGVGGPPAAAELVERLRQLLAHYGWELLPFGPQDKLTQWERRRVPWNWPHLPPLPPALLEGIRRAATALLGDSRPLSDYERPSPQPEQGAAVSPPIKIGQEAMTRKRENASRPRKQDARDKWIYAQCCDTNIQYKTIIAKLKGLIEKKGWQHITSIQGIRRAASNYAERHNIIPPPTRQGL